VSFMSSHIKSAMQLALDQARIFRGATSPNPPVGAAGLSEKGEVLSVQAHEKAGTLHAEAKVIEDCRARRVLSQLHTLVVTLEPCNHQGRTPACTEAIMASPIRHVVFGTKDPNPRVQGGGVERLAEAGIQVQEIPSEIIRGQCQALIEPFAYWSRTGLPWITVKTAIDSTGSMIPVQGERTFTSLTSLRFGHELRKRADAVLTGSGTVLADNPEFTVRHVPDHAGKKRWLVVLDRRQRTPSQWLEGRESAGFQVMRRESIQESLQYLGSQGVLEVLVEAGPTVSAQFLEYGLWNEHFVITQGDPDRIERRKNVHRHH
jgi:diaminohydroxyphosphoribosylaminopyrimidine deaminase / 5-amino-6-(5-phosphoribosylamino)uracil reductase